MRGSGDVKVGSSDWFRRFVAFRAVRVLKEGLPLLIAVPSSADLTNTRFVFAKQR